MICSRVIPCDPSDKRLWRLVSRFTEPLDFTQIDNLFAPFTEKSIPFRIALGPTTTTPATSTATCRSGHMDTSGCNLLREYFIDGWKRAPFEFPFSGAFHVGRSRWTCLSLTGSPHKVSLPK